MHAFRLNIIAEIGPQNLFVPEELVTQLCVKKNINLNDLPHYFLQIKCSNQRICTVYGCDRWHGTVEKRVGSCLLNLISRVFHVIIFHVFFFFFVCFVGPVCLSRMHVTSKTDVSQTIQNTQPNESGSLICKRRLRIKSWPRILFLCFANKKLCLLLQRFFLFFFHKWFFSHFVSFLFFSCDKTMLKHLGLNYSANNSKNIIKTSIFSFARFNFIFIIWVYAIFYVTFFQASIRICFSFD